jgi:hypothetical protein
MQKTKGKLIKTITVIDPDSKGEVEIEIYKLEGGGMVGIDGSFMETSLPVYSPFDKNIEIDFED